MLNEYETTGEIKNLQGKPKDQGKKFTRATLSAINPT
jgi:hypothetical protein